MLKPVDNVVLIALAAWNKNIHSQAEFAKLLQIPTASLFRSLKRIEQANLVSRSEDFSVNKLNLLEYLSHAIRFVFPAKLGTIVRGMNTAYSAPPLNELLHSQENIVWPTEYGSSTGLELIPIHKNIPALSVAYPELYHPFAVIDAIRIGKAREQELARRYLKSWIVHD